jgi:hypothetical protein
VNPHGDQAAFCNPPLGELQKKAHLYMLAVASAPLSAGKGIAVHYLCMGLKSRP